MTKRVSDFRPARRNANRHTARGLGALQASIESDGWIGAMTTAADGEMIAGSARIETAAQVFGVDAEPIVVESDGTRPIVVVRKDIPTAADPRAVRLGLADNRVAELSLDWDPEVLCSFDAATLEPLWSPKELSNIGLRWANDVAGDNIDTDGDLSDDGGIRLTRHDVPDMVFPTDNDWGVPLLDAKLQATGLVAPFVRWGTGSRRTRHSGTNHFYTDDYRFSALWDDPAPVVNSGCSAVVEPNFSIYIDMPAAVALWAVYRKRWLARFWQMYGIRVFADLNVAENHADLNLLGIPKGWRSWATRGYTERMDSTIREYERAVVHAGTDDILFLVYGGGKQVEALCRKRGWLWQMERSDEVTHGQG